MPRFLIQILCAVLFTFTAGAVAQQPVTTPDDSVPRLIRFGGTLTGHGIRTVGITFALYKDHEGGAALWQEVQNVAIGASGHYTVLLGSASKNGVPAELFTTNEARWLGVQVEQEAEQARVLLVSVPYALKSGDAQTVGGHPLSDFVLSTTTNGSTTASSSTTTSGTSGTKTSATQSSVVPLAGGVGAGNMNAMAKYDGSGNLLGSTLVFDTGSAFGVGTQTPAAALDVNNTTAPASGVTPYGSALSTRSPSGRPTIFRRIISVRFTAAPPPRATFMA